MKATITSDGCLTVSAETELEEYALEHWHHQWNKARSTLNIAITHGGGKIEPFEMPGNELPRGAHENNDH